MKFTKIRAGVSAEWKSVTSEATFFINKTTTPNLGVVMYEASICFKNGGAKILGHNFQYLRDAKKALNDFYTEQ